MALTRAQTERELVDRLKGLLRAARMNATTVDGTNSSLNSPIARAIRDIGGSVTNPSLVVDADLTSVGDVVAFFDYAELRTRETIDGNLGKSTVDLKAGDIDGKFNQLRQANDRAMARLRIQLGVDTTGTLTAGVINYGFLSLNS